MWWLFWLLLSTCVFGCIGAMILMAVWDMTD